MQKECSVRWNRQRLDVCFEHYPEFLKNPNIRQKVVELLQKAKEYIVKLEGEFAYD